MARPVGADAEATRGRILRCAARLFAEHGEGNTSMRDIGRAAGVSLATVHHYFGSKDDLYKAAVDSMYVELEALRDELTRTVEPGRPLPETIENAVRTTFRFASEHRPAVQLVMRTVIDTGELAEERRSGLLLPFLDEGAELLSGPSKLPKEELRLLLHSMNHLIVRYALTEPKEHQLVVRAESERDAMRTIEDHLVLVALRLMGLEEEAARRARPEERPEERPGMGPGNGAAGRPHQS